VKVPTGAEAVGADGSLRAVRAQVAFLPLLLGRLGLGQHRPLVLRPEGKEHQAGNATAGASFLW